MSPLVSVVIASKNQAKYLRATIEALKLQTYQHFEVIVVDAFSTDDTEEICREYSMVQFIQGQYHACAAWEYGIQIATGKYLMIGTTSDYLFNPRWISRGIEALEADSELAMVWSSAVTIDERGYITGCWGSDFWALPPPRKEDYLPYWFVRHYVPELNYIVRRDVYLNCLTNNEYNSYSEYDIFHHVMFNFTRLGYLQRYLKDIGHAGREHRGALGSLQRQEIRKAQRRIVFAKLKFFCDLLAGRKAFFFVNAGGVHIRKLSKLRIFLLPWAIAIHFAVLRYLKITEWLKRRVARFAYKILRIPRSEN